MEREISIFDKKQIQDLFEVTETIRESYGISVRIVEILGRRWSHVAGQNEDEISFLPSLCIPVTDRFGIVTDGWTGMTEGCREEIISLIKYALETNGKG